MQIGLLYTLAWVRQGWEKIRSLYILTCFSNTSVGAEMKLLKLMKLQYKIQP